jgi:restriction endonuclease S subunit
LLEGLEITIISKSQILKDNSEFRIDSEYYKTEYLELYKKLIGTPILNELVDMSDLSTNGSFAAVAEIIHDNKPKIIPFIRSGNTGDTFINKSELDFISKEAHERLPKSTTHLHDIMMARKGKIGGASIIMPEDVDFNCNENVIKLDIRDKKKINPFYFTAFFNSKYGLKQVERLSTGNVQPWVSIFQIRKLKLFVPSIGFQNEIEKIILKSHQNIQDSKQQYLEAENKILEIVGLNNFKPKQEAVNIKSFKDSFLATGRIDAEYYQKKYETITNAVKSYKNGFSTLESFISDYSTGFPYKSETYCEDGIPLIRINNISKGDLDISNATNIPYSDLNLSIKDIVKENDILISMSGTIGNSCKIPKGIKAVVNQRIMRITPKGYNVDVLPILINSLIGQYQLERIGTGGVQTNISATDVKLILVPNIDATTQSKIADLVKSSYKLKNNSKDLLNVAKTAIDIAIDTDEKSALKFIKENA